MIHIVHCDFGELFNDNWEFVGIDVYSGVKL